MIFTLPDLDVSFEKVVIKKAEEFSKTYLAIGGIVHGYTGNMEMIRRELSSVYYDLPNQTDRFVFIREIMLHIIAIKGKYNEDIQRNLPQNKRGQSERMLSGLAEANDILDEFMHFLAGLLIRDGYNIDTNAFSYEEKVAVDEKLNNIIYTLEKLQAGQEVIYEEFEGIKAKIEEEFSKLKSETILGKKTFFQLALGKVGTFAGNKLADQIFEQIKPQLILFFATQAPHLLDSFQKLLH